MEMKMPVFMKYDGVDGQINETDRFDFSRLTIEPTAPENKPSLIVKLDIGGPPGVQDDGLLLPAVQDDAAIARTNKPSLVVKFDIGGPPGVQDHGLLLHGSDFLV